MSEILTPGRAAAELGLDIRPPASWDLLLEAAVRRYWHRRREHRGRAKASLTEVR